MLKFTSRTSGAHVAVPLSKIVAMSEIDGVVHVSVIDLPDAIQSVEDLETLVDQVSDTVRQKLNF